MKIIQIALLTFSFIFIALPISAKNLSGNYSVVGKNPNGTPYRGTVKITKKGSTYYFKWKVGAQYSGKGKLSNDILTIDWGDKYPVIYSVQSNGVLKGTWANGQASETLTKQ